MKKAAYIFSDFSYPVSEGLHEQSALSLSRLQRLGYDVDVYLMAKDLERVDFDAFFSELNVLPKLCLECGPTALIVQALVANAFSWIPVSKYGPIRSSIIKGNYDLYHFDGIVACALSPISLRSRSIMSLVDPGSRRYERFATQSQTLLSKTRYMAVSKLYHWLEKSFRKGKGFWHVVSASDRRYLISKHDYERVVDIPVSVPTTLKLFDETSKDFGGQIGKKILIYCDLRQRHMQEAVCELVEKTFSHSKEIQRCEIIVLGRVVPANSFREKFANYNTTFYSSVDNYLTILAGAHVVILPDTVGTGLKNRAIQSMALGRAVMATPVALEGLPATDGISCVVMDGQNDALKLDSLLSSAEKRLALGKEAQHVVNDTFGEYRIQQLWSEIYERVAR